MDLAEYQLEAIKTAQYGDPRYLRFSILEESGEICGCFARQYREGLDEESVVKECGDVLWNLALICHEHKRSLANTLYHKYPKPRSDREEVARWIYRLGGLISDNLIEDTVSMITVGVMLNYLEFVSGRDILDIAEHNLGKLRERQSKKMIVGRGDDREKSVSGD